MKNKGEVAALAKTVKLESRFKSLEGLLKRGVLTGKEGTELVGQISDGVVALAARLGRRFGCGDPRLFLDGERVSGEAALRVPLEVAEGTHEYGAVCRAGGNTREGKAQGAAKHQ